ncbi:Card1-like endonuclease domain-containing protein [Methylococcus sp. Mc7]|uniref:Card1-like endonuclease domain-containing protein n=1 Tax=Methylococcus sp. Mc7 TaxID=2860258 RepID=UPI001C529381|nr:DUF1887 family CARF protein [Methylococcus sp. Mc7]QXP83824.1 DUF1887 family protein [Methylococcus sp. Mc7]
MKIHVAIVSEQILPNFIPALMERPDWVCLVASPQMSERGLDRRLARLLRQDEIAVEIRKGAPESGLADIHSFAYALAEELEARYPGAEIVLNATGGTKLMALGFVEAFRDLGVRIIYTDTAHRRIECLSDGKDSIPAAKPMDEVLDVPRYLAAQGFRVSVVQSDSPEWQERAAGRKAVCKYLGQHAAQIGDLIGALNALADKALVGGETLVAPHQAFARVPWGNWATALGQLVKAHLLKWQDGSADVEFVDAESATFLHGGWLEELAWHTLQDNGAYDARLGVNGNWETGINSKNEFDVLATQGNQLLFVECKTLRHLEENDNDLAYKVDSLGQDARGLFGATWLVTAREPSLVLRERARQARICHFGPAELPKLREHVRAWLTGAR